MGEIGYKWVFVEAEQLSKTVDYTEYFPNWREHPELFHFIMANERDRRGTDTSALQAAANLGESLYLRLIAKGPSTAGGANDHIDVIEARHILMMCYLYSRIGSNWGNVVEIGGGYGNCFRLMHDQIHYDSWNIIDLKYILDLQKWFFLNEGAYSDVVTFNTEVPDVVPTVVLASHSMSEFSWDDFAKYYEYIKQADCLFYAAHNSNPDYELLQRKLALIKQDFYEFSALPYEGGGSTMYIFKNSR